jgi:hypothetical protein
MNATLSLNGKTIFNDDREKLSNDEKRAVKNLLMEADSSMDVFQSTYNRESQEKDRNSKANRLERTNSNS